MSNRYYLAHKDPKYSDDQRKHSNIHDIDELMKKLDELKQEKRNLQSERNRQSLSNQMIINQLSPEQQEQWKRIAKKKELQNVLRLGGDIQQSHRPSTICLQHQIFRRAHNDMDEVFKKQYDGTSKDPLLSEIEMTLQEMNIKKLELEGNLQEIKYKLESVHTAEQQLKRQIQLYSRIDEIMKERHQEVKQLCGMKNTANRLRFLLNWERFKNAGRQLISELTPSQGPFVLKFCDKISTITQQSMEIDQLVEHFFNQPKTPVQQELLFRLISYIHGGKLRQFQTNKGKALIVQVSKRIRSRKIQELRSLHALL